MDLYYLDNHIDELLAQKADQLYSPIGGTFELSPLCNMDCKMCYIRQTKNEVSKQGGLLSYEQWISIAEQAKENGVLFLLLTGGEPLLYPDFEKLYLKLITMGFIISINTNATLLNEHWADIFMKHPCRRINITLYGKDDATYQRLCHNPTGFTSVMKAASLLKERNIPFRFTCSVTPDNKEQLHELHVIAEKYNVPLSVCNYMFPPNRRFDDSPKFMRLSPEEAAETFVETYIEKYSQQDLISVAQNTLNKIGTQVDYSMLDGLTCRAGRSGFWINWKGEMLPCAMFHTPKISLLDHSFDQAWDYIVHETKKIQRCQECESCNKREICKTCAAACLTETGSFSAVPRYLCKMTDTLIDLCQTIVKS